ncbi:MAG: hypothetical protein E6Q59_09215 [Nitrosomonas sp.]|nr:MAG: hypothetical protein E6Q59_09215 [Nitrosomonas sp.]
MEKARQNRNPQSASKAAANHVSQHKNENRDTLEFVDNRPETAVQRRLIETIRNSPKAREAAQLKAVTRSASHSKQVAQRATAIKHEAGSIKFGMPQEEQLVGKKMEAELDAADPVVGTATGTQWTWTRRLRNLFRGAGVVRGHLLNHDLGGHAIPENLYPISTKANSDHSARVEQPVKKLLNEAASNIPIDNKGALKKDVATHYVHYSVTVAEDKADDPTKATFKCSFGVGTNPKTQQDIRSELDADKDRYSASAGLIHGQSKVMPLDNWAHKKAKFQPGTTAIDTTRISATIPGKLSNLPGPELVKGSEPDYQLIYKTILYVYSGIAERTKHTTTFATYRVDQDLVQKHLLGLKSFCDDLEDISADLNKANLPAIEKILMDATKAAAESISPLNLPRKAMKQPYKQIAAKAKKDMHLLYVYYAVQAGQPNVSVKDIKVILKDNFASSTSKKEVVSALQELADLELVQVIMGRWWNTV